MTAGISCPSSTCHCQVEVRAPSCPWGEKLPLKTDDLPLVNDVGCGRQGETTTLKILMDISTGKTGLFSLVRQPVYGRTPRQKIGLDVKPEGGSPTIRLTLRYASNISRGHIHY